jgi:nucleotide-binding universal stress UspA family protein
MILSHQRHHASRGCYSQAAFIARAFSARIHLLGMIYSRSRQRSALKIRIVNATKPKQAVLAELATQLETQGVPTELALLDMPTFETFIRYVQDHDFDLIVFAGDGQMTQMLIPDVLAHISVPVLVARSQPIERFRRILLPLDGSQRAECMMPLVTMLAQTMDTTLLLAHIIKEPEMPRRISLSAEDIQLSEQLIERNRQEGERYLTDLSARVPVATEIYVGVQQRYHCAA